MLEYYQSYYQRNRKWIFWLAQFMIWTAYFLFDLVVIHRYSLMSSIMGESNRIFYPLIYCYFGLVFTLILKTVFDLFIKRLRSVPILFLVGIGLPLILANVWYLVGLGLDQAFGRLGYANPLVDYLWDVFISALVLIAWSAVYLFVKFFEQWTDQRHQTQQALLQAENAQLKTLRYQLNPHFLFNSLSSLRALIREDPSRATGMVTKLADLLRYSLVEKNDLFCSLEKEIKAIRNYVDMESIRFGDKLNVKYNVDEQSMKVLIPSFMIHPLVENAIKYGMQTSKMPLQIEIRSEMVNSRLFFSVCNSGSWVDEGEKDQGTGTGLTNIQERLNHLYSGSHRFEIMKSDEEIKVFIEIENVSHAE